MISSLAEQLGRNRCAVTRDVKLLAGYRLVRVLRENNPGHGIVQMVEAVADKLVMQADI